MDSKAEENLTAARQYRREANQAIEQMKVAQTSMQAIQDRAGELQNAISQVKDRFHQVKAKLSNNYCDDNNFKGLMLMGKAIKNLLDIPILQDDGSAIDRVRLSSQIEKTIQVGN